MQSTLRKPLGDGGVALGRPALGAPAGSGSDKSDGPRGSRKCVCEPSGAPGFGLGIDWQLRVNSGKRVTGDGGGEFHVLLDDVRAVRNDALGEKPLGRPLARARFADAARAAAHARDDCGADCALKVENSAVFRGAKLAAQGSDRPARGGTQRMALPFPAGSEVQAIDDRHCGVAGIADP